MLTLWGTFKNVDEAKKLTLRCLLTFTPGQ
jgi:hypothetical protein